MAGRLAPMLTGPIETVRFARELRREMSLPEVLLWRELRKRPGGLKFRRQHAAGGYVLDFFCAELKLAVEVDGADHYRADAPAHDAERDAWLARQNIQVARLSAREVLASPDLAARRLAAGFGHSLRPSTASRSPSPFRGGSSEFGS